MQRIYRGELHLKKNAHGGNIHIDIKDIVYESGKLWVLRTKRGFEVYRSELTHSVKVAVIGWAGKKGEELAIAEVDRRNKEERV